MVDPPWPWRRRAGLPRRRSAGLKACTTWEGSGGRDRTIAAVGAPQSAGGRGGAVDGVDVLRRSRETSQRHVVVDALVLAGVHQERLVPDADVAVRADFLVELHPVGIVHLVAIAGVGNQLLERPPVLDVRGQTEALPSKKTAVGV